MSDAIRALVSPRRFPVLERGISYLDSAATCLSPDCVIDAMASYERTSRSNVHRGIHQLAEESTEAYEGARETVARFVGASPENLAFTRGATDSLNMAASALVAGGAITPGSVVVAIEDAHHSNYLPWMMAARRAGARFVSIPVDRCGRPKASAWNDALTSNPSVVALTCAGNVFAAPYDAVLLAAQARAAGALVAMDCAQAVGHRPVDVRGLGADMAAWSAHKMYGPMGIGALWCSDAALQHMVSPCAGGGSALSVTAQGFEPLPFPQGFEPGTPSVGCAVGFAAAARFLEGLDMGAVENHDVSLAALAGEGLACLGVVEVLGSPEPGAAAAPAAPAALVSFNVEGVHPHDIAQVLSDGGVAVRAGHHCAMPLHARLGCPASVRASFGVYNSARDVERLCSLVERAWEMYGNR